MAINLEDLKKVIEPLLDGRDDAADLIDAIVALDVEDSGLTQADIDAAVAASDASWNERYRAQFFNPTIETPTAVDVPITTEDEAEGTVTDYEDLTFEDLFTEKE